MNENIPKGALMVVAVVFVASAEQQRQQEEERLKNGLHRRVSGDESNAPSRRERSAAARALRSCSVIKCRRASRTAAAASMMPAPHVAVVHVASGNGRTEAVKIFFTVAASSSGRRPTISEAMPLTIGAEKLVPASPTTVGEPGTVNPVFPSVLMRSPESPPGAAMATVLPKLE